jgi:FkbM family methyltransferase
MGILELVAAAVVGIWLVYFALRGSLIAGCLAFLLATCCFGYPFLHIDGGPLPLTIDRLVIAGLTGLYIVQRAVGRTEPKPLRVVDKLLLAFLAVLAISTFTHQWRNLPPAVVPPVWRLFTGYAIPVIIYWIARQSRLTRRQIGLAQGSLAVFGLYLAITGLLEISRQWSFVFPHYIADPTVGLHFGRARGPMVQAVSYGLFLTITTLAVFVWQIRLNRFGRAFWLAVIPVQLAALGCTYTRSIWIGVGLSTVVVLALMLKGRWRNFVVGGIVTVASLAAIMNLNSLTDLHREGSVTEARESVGMRASFNYVSWKMFLDRPLFGFGFGQFYTEKMAYLSDRSTPLQLELIRDYINHNTYLDLLAETGIIGFALFAAVLACWIRTGLRLARAGNSRWIRSQGILLLGALATYCVQMMFHEVSYTSIDNSLIFLLAGLAVGLETQLLKTKAAVQAFAEHCEPIAVESAALRSNIAAGWVDQDDQQAAAAQLGSRAPLPVSPPRHNPLETARTLFRTLLRRWPRMYLIARRTYGVMIFWLGVPHEPEYRLLAALQGSKGLFVDVGANSGQSARSFRVFNTSLDILSFEPNRLLEPDLRFTRRLLGPTFRYRMQGLGSAPSRTTLYVPQRGPTSHTPWATLERELLLRDRAMIERELGGPFRIVETPVEVQRFDDLGLHPAVIKIDVEGLELDVLQGMEAALAQDEPLLLIEQNSSSASVAAWLEARGYLLWAYDAQRHHLRRWRSNERFSNFVACTRAWLERHPSVALLIGEDEPAVVGAS